MIGLALEFIKFTPVYLFFFAGLGIPWALVLLPRDDWRDRATVFALGLAMGPIIGTTWLFVLGDWFSFELGLILAGLIVLMGIGIFAAWKRLPANESRSRDDSDITPRFFALTLLSIIGLGFLVHVAAVIFWPFIYYDTLWTYGYNPRVFLIFNEIPDWIHYYPKLLHLTYSFGAFVNGAIDDHASRAAIPWFILGGVMMAYLLGSRVWGKRSIGLLTAALWFLTPATFFWSFSGDVEHALTFYFTGATVFFVLAWRSPSYRYAIIAGLLFGGALWSKPTAAAWAIGVILIVICSAISRLLSEMISFPVDEQIVLSRKRLTVVAITGMTSIPIGSMWYLRNILLGHSPVRFPPGYWHDLAQRSGEQLQWFILIAALGAGYGIYRLRLQNAQRSSRKIVLICLGLALLLAGALPSMFNSELPVTFQTLSNWIIGMHSPRGPLTTIETIAVLMGGSLLVSQLYPFWRKASAQARSATMLTGLIVVPYTVVWFLFYSYQTRLMFAIVPVFAAMAAALINAWLVPLIDHHPVRLRAAILIIGVTGIIGPMTLVGFTLRYAWQGVDTDQEKYEALNPSLMVIVDATQKYIDEINDYPTIYTFNEHRLQFFLPELNTIHQWETPTAFSEFETEPDILIGGSKAQLVWERVAGVYPNQISAYMDIGYIYDDAPLLFQEDSLWPLLLEPFAEHEGFSHHLIAYEYNAASRNIDMDDVQPSFSFANMQWSSGLALRGLDFRDGETNRWIQPDANGKIHLSSGQRVYVQLYWQRLTDAPVPTDYDISIRMYDVEDGQSIDIHDDAILSEEFPVSLLLFPDLFPDRHIWMLPETTGAFNLSIELRNPVDGAIISLHDAEAPKERLVLEGIILLEEF